MSERRQMQLVTPSRQLCLTALFFWLPAQHRINRQPQLPRKDSSSVLSAFQLTVLERAPYDPTAQLELKA
jgi:hypothetical protein